MAESISSIPLTGVRRRLVTVGAIAAAFWGVSAFVVLMLVAMWFDLVWDLASPLRAVTLPVLLAAGFALAVALAVGTLRQARASRLARRLDAAGGTGGKILSGWELEQQLRSPGPGNLRPVTAGLAHLAVSNAARLADQVPSSRAVPLRPLARAAAAAGLVGAVVALLVVVMPGVARTQWNRFAHPTADVPPYALTEFDVTPGDTSVPYGDELDVWAQTRGEPVDELELVLRGAQGQPEALPMFQEPDGRWRAIIAKVTEPAEYFVRAYQARSHTYRIDVITLPQIRDVRVQITPPAYTNQGPYEGPVPQEGIVGVLGTRVQLWAESNRPLSRGSLRLQLGKEGSEVSFQPTTSGGSEVTGRFEITADGTFELRVVDVAGQPSREAFASTITRLPDERPFVRLVQPRTASLATPTASIPVETDAEDDYGVSRLQLFRSLNHSRPRPTDRDLPPETSRRVHDVTYLPLSEYGLRPGDEIKLFARVSDNDPAGAKGSESSVVTVHVISQEEYERLLRVREGLNVLMSKYRQAQRRLENLAEEIKGLQKQLKEQDEKGLVSKQQREQLDKLIRRLELEAKEIAAAAAHRLPYDIDENLSQQLDRLADQLTRGADDLQRLTGNQQLIRGELARELAKLASQLGQQADLYAENAMVPLELLERIFPLVADQAKFVDIVMRQKDLAERTAALKGRDGEDDPAVKARMRDLEEEQRTIRDDLERLLDDIEDHVQLLPEDEQLDKLRQTATEFVEAVRQSGAADAMSDAEQALSDFQGTRAHEKALEAAEILEKFLQQCDAMGSCAGGCLVFRPSLGQCIGNSVAQLLAEMGLGFGSGSGSGFGSGSGNGFSARRGMMQNMGLYGSMPGLTGQEGGPFGRSGDGRERERTAAFGGASDDAASLLGVPGMGQAGGAAEAAVPLRYRKRVGQYFRRVAEELEE